MKRCAGFIVCGWSCICSCLQLCQKAFMVSLKATLFFAFLYIRQLLAVRILTENQTYLDMLSMSFRTMS